jgi:hypothetical protein
MYGVRQKPSNKLVVEDLDSDEAAYQRGHYLGREARLDLGRIGVYAGACDPGDSEPYEPQVPRLDAVSRTMWRYPNGRTFRKRARCDPCGRADSATPEVRTERDVLR